jgi:hypothetical protein
MKRAPRRTVLAVAVAALAAPVGASAAGSYSYTLVSATGSVNIQYDGAGEGLWSSVGAAPYVFTGSLKGNYRVNWSFVPRKIGSRPISRSIIFSTASIPALPRNPRVPFGFAAAGFFGPINATWSMSFSGVGGDGVTRSCSGQGGIRTGRPGAPGTIGLHVAKQGGVLRTSVRHFDTNEGNLFGPLLLPACTEAFKSVQVTEGQETFGRLPLTTIRRTKRGSKVVFNVKTTTPYTARTAAGADVQVGTKTQRSDFVLKLDLAT